MEKFERDSKIIMGIENLSNWKPNLKKIAEENDIAVSTVHATYNRLQHQNRIKLWVTIITEEEAHKLFLKKQLQAKQDKRVCEHGFINIEAEGGFKICPECR